MRMIVEIPESQLKRIQEYLDRSTYNDFNTFLLAATENQLLIENGSVVDEKSNATFKRKVIKIEKNLSIYDLKLTEQQRKRFLVDIPPTILAPLPKEIACLEGVDEKDAWTWGQINRIFPMKVAVRVLLKMISSSIEGAEGNEKIFNQVSFNSFIEGCCNAAKNLGEIVQVNEQNERGNRISAALPTGHDVGKAASRFTHHFLMTIRKNKQLDGGLARFKLANIIMGTDEESSIGITDQGLTFALLENPVLDMGRYEKAFSEQEIDFLITHFKNEVPGEFNSITWFLQAIKKGANRRTKLNEALMEYARQRKFDWSDAVIATQRAGLTSRCVEIGLIQRDKKGLEVKYYLTKGGRELLKSNL